MDNRLCIIPCGRKKIWDLDATKGPTPAQDAYIGTFGQACQRYARRFFPGNWVILSAKYGFLFPADHVPGPYDVAFDSPREDVIPSHVLKVQLEQKQLTNYRTVVVLGGRKHQKVVESVFPADVERSYPLKDCKGIGYMLQALNRAVRTGQEHTPFV